MVATMNVIAREGLERLTTKSVESESNISERYIFLLYGNKDALLKQTFDTIEKTYVAVLCSEFRKAFETETKTEVILHRAWLANWKYATGNPVMTKFYIRYYYSEQFERYSKEDHSRNLAPLLEIVRPMFADRKYADDTLGYIFTTMLSSALASITGTQSSDEVLSERIFRMLFQSIKDQLATR